MTRTLGRAMPCLAYLDSRGERTGFASPIEVVRGPWQEDGIALSVRCNDDVEGKRLLCRVDSHDFETGFKRVNSHWQADFLFKTPPIDLRHLPLEAAEYFVMQSGSLIGLLLGWRQRRRDAFDDAFLEIERLIERYVARICRDFFESDVTREFLLDKVKDAVLEELDLEISDGEFLTEDVGDSTEDEVLDAADPSDPCEVAPSQNEGDEPSPSGPSGEVVRGKLTNRCRRRRTQIELGDERSFRAFLFQKVRWRCGSAVTSLRSLPIDGRDIPDRNGPEYLALFRDCIVFLSAKASDLMDRGGNKTLPRTIYDTIDWIMDCLAAFHDDCEHPSDMRDANANLDDLLRGADMDRIAFDEHDFQEYLRQRESERRVPIPDEEKAELAKKLLPNLRIKCAELERTLDWLKICLAKHTGPERADDDATKRAITTLHRQSFGKADWKKFSEARQSDGKGALSEREKAKLASSVLQKLIAKWANRGKAANGRCMCGCCADDEITWMAKSNLEYLDLEASKHLICHIEQCEMCEQRLGAAIEKRRIRDTAHQNIRRLRDFLGPQFGWGKDRR